MFVYQEAPQGGEALGAFAVGVDGEAIDVGKGSLQPVAFDAGTSQRHLTVTIALVSGRFVVAAEYDTDLFDAAFARTLLTHYEQLLDACLTEPGRCLSRVPMLSAAERQWLLGDRPPVADVLSTACLHERFEAQAAMTAGAIAVRCGHEDITYTELNRRANQLARQLRARGAGPDRLVAIDMERSLDLAIAIIATLKAGAAYLPLDPAYPRERVAFMLGDAQPVVVLTHAARLSGTPADFALAAALRRRGARGDRGTGRDEPRPVRTPAASATARIRHLHLRIDRSAQGLHGDASQRSAALRPPAGRMQFGGDDTWTMFHSAAFDFSVWEMWGACCTAGAS